MPLHVAISEAILGSDAEIAPLLDMLQFYPDLAQASYCRFRSASSMPGAGTRRRWTAVGKGVRFAAEGWDEPQGSPT